MKEENIQVVVKPSIKKFWVLLIFYIAIVYGIYKEPRVARYITGIFTELDKVKSFHSFTGAVMQKPEMYASLFIGLFFIFPIIGVFARRAIDDGADVVLMQGPHVLRAVDVYKNKFIAYSLGNLSLYGEYPPVISALIKIEINKNGNFVKGKIYPLVVTGKGVPVIDKDKKAIKLISALTKEDIPESRVIIDNSGNIILQR
jgi:uncharacterized membrane protein YhaH (DUF805 family)